MEYFDVNKDIDNIFLFTNTHSPADNLDFLVEKRNDCRHMVVELKRIYYDENYNACTVNNRYREQIIERIRIMFVPDDRAGIKSFLKTSRKNIREYILKHIKILIEENESAKHKKTESELPQINLLRESRIIFKLIGLLIKNKYLGRTTRIEILYHFLCNDKFIRDPRVPHSHRFVWLTTGIELAYTINKMVEKGYIHEYGKFVLLLPHFVNKYKENYKNFLSQSIHNKTFGLNDYINPQIDAIFNEVEEYAQKLKKKESKNGSKRI